MASADLNVSVKQDWALANPWPWLGAGFVLALWSWLWTLTFEAHASDNRIIVLALGLLLAGVGVWLRWNDRQTLYLRACPPIVPLVARLTMGGLFGLLALGLTILLVLTLIQWNGINWKPGATSLIWLSVVPMSWFASRRCLKPQTEQTPIDVEEEIGLVFLVAAVTCGMGSMTLYLGADLATEWDTMRLFLRVLTAVALIGSALALVSLKLRRLILSLLLLLHFAGISTACLSAPPSPWVIQQIWVRVFRPYLEFMYLNNAYHFYAPEPGPASYLWFRVIYSMPDGNEVGLWYKVPEVDEKGHSHHSVSLEYQRFLALTEQTNPSETPPPAVYTNAQGMLDGHPMFVNRLQLLPGQQLPAIVGAPQQAKRLRIPLHPGIPQMQQIMIPNESTRRLLASYARFVARKFAKNPDDASLVFKSVKIYHVVHWVPPSPLLNTGILPTDPELYRPFYAGDYHADGTLTEDAKSDPYLYWLLPILRDNGADPDSSIKDWCRRHAGDANWVRLNPKDAWRDPNAPLPGLRPDAIK